MEPLAELIGESPEIVAVREQIRRLLQRQSGSRRLPPILIQGETGTHLEEAHHLFRVLQVPKYVERAEQLAREFGLPFSNAWITAGSRLSSASQEK